jgi:hypothetical protein
MAILDTLKKRPAGAGPGSPDVLMGFQAASEGLIFTNAAA